MSATQLKALCLVVLIASCVAAGTNGESAQQRSRKLLQPRNPTNIQTNTVRAQAATSQSIEEAVRGGASPSSTRRAGVTGVATSWAAGQRDDIYNTVDRAFSPTTAYRG